MEHGALDFALGRRLPRAPLVGCATALAARLYVVIAIACLIVACERTGASDAGMDDAGSDMRLDANIPDGGPPQPLPELEFEPITLAEDPLAVTDFVFVPGTEDEIYLTTLDGTVRHYRIEGGTTALLGSFSIDTVLDAECGLISIALDPDFETNRFAYLGHCTSPQASRVTRIELAPDGYADAWGTAELIVEVEESVAPRGWHNVGRFGFEPDGVMWIFFGDKTEAAQSQDTQELNGKLLRIVPNRTPGEGGYQPAPGNPFSGDDGDPAVYAYGVRSPWRGTRDSRGRYWVGDVGNHAFEEVNVVTAPGQNFGWPNAEGPCTSECDGLQDPLRSYSHGSGDAIFFEDPEIVSAEYRSVWVGPEYLARSGDRYEGTMTGRVLWGDFAMGFVRVIELDAANQVRAEGNVGHFETPSAWREGPDGYLYVASLGGTDPEAPAPGALYRAVLRD